jgi:putative ABC transport system permease protein
MQVGTYLQLAARALWRNKSRALLTALGVIIGVGSVITMISVGEGAQQRIAAEIEKLGSYALTVRPGGSRRGGVHRVADSKLTREDAQAIAALVGVLNVSPAVRSAEQVRYRGANWQTNIDGATPAILAVKGWRVMDGEFFTDRDDAAAAAVCVLGTTVARELFGLQRPVGELVLIRGIACRVVGVLAERGAGVWGEDQDDGIWMPLNTVQRKLRGNPNLQWVDVQAGNRDDAFRLVGDITTLLRERHRVGEDEDNDFRVLNRAAMAQSAEESAHVFTWLLGSIASVSLLVGGIGIMNIMLVSVTERTKEIGIRMALGARRRDVLWQFLLEALLLSLAGGLIGVLAGIGGAHLLAEFSQFAVTIAPWSVVLAFAFSALVGMFFGLHPARRASRLKPIEALRYE